VRELLCGGRSGHAVLGAHRASGLIMSRHGIPGDSLGCVREIHECDLRDSLDVLCRSCTLSRQLFFDAAKAHCDELLAY
jgi:hypothetical protein